MFFQAFSQFYDWNEEFEKLNNEIFEFAEKYGIPILTNDFCLSYVHIGEIFKIHT